MKNLIFYGLVLFLVTGCGLMPKKPVEIARDVYECSFDFEGVFSENYQNIASGTEATGNVYFLVDPYDDIASSPVLGQFVTDATLSKVTLKVGAEAASADIGWITVGLDQFSSARSNFDWIRIHAINASGVIGGKAQNEEALSFKLRNETPFLNDDTLHNNEKKSADFRERKIKLVDSSQPSGFLEIVDIVSLVNHSCSYTRAP